MIEKTTDQPPVGSQPLRSADPLPSRNLPRLQFDPAKTLDAQLMELKANLDTIAETLRDVHQWAGADRGVLRGAGSRAHPVQGGREGGGSANGLPLRAPSQGHTCRNGLGKGPNITLDVVGGGLGDAGDANVRACARCFVRVRIVEDLLPGEHGFRFFPSFYRNLFDTMKRIPIPERGKVYRETGSTVYDNLLPTELQGFAFKGGRWLTVPRRPMGSLREAIDVLRNLLESFGCARADATRLPLRLFKYVTSCRARRETEYEKMSWWDFIDGDAFEEPMRRYLNDGPQLLVAMNARRSDARTIGTIAAQLFLDHLKPNDRTDATLNAPTTSAWFDPWRRYLTHQGVQFMPGALESLRVDERSITAFVRGNSQATGEVGELSAVNPDYVIVAAPPDEVKKVIQASVGRPPPASVDRVARVASALRLEADPNTGRICRMRLDPEQQHHPEYLRGEIAGVQLFFETEITFFHGHVIYPDSDWALSSVAQPQFWRQKLGEWSGYRGILSVDVGNWHRPSSKTRRCASESTRDEIGREVWRQIKRDASVPGGRPGADWFWIDDHLVFHASGSGRGGVKENELTFVINPPGTYADRPGIFDHQPGERDRLGGEPDAPPAIPARVWRPPRVRRVVGTHPHPSELDGGGERVRPSGRERHPAGGRSEESWRPRVRALHGRRP